MGSQRLCCYSDGLQLGAAVGAERSAGLCLCAAVRAVHCLRLGLFGIGLLLVGGSGRIRVRRILRLRSVIGHIVGSAGSRLIRGSAVGSGIDALLDVSDILVVAQRDDRDKDVDQGIGQTCREQDAAHTGKHKTGTHGENGEYRHDDVEHTEGYCALALELGSGDTALDGAVEVLAADKVDDRDNRIYDQDKAEEYHDSNDSAGIIGVITVACDDADNKDADVGDGEEHNADDGEYQRDHRQHIQDVDARDRRGRLGGVTALDKDKDVRDRDEDREDRGNDRGEDRGGSRGGGDHIPVLIGQIDAAAGQVVEHTVNDRSIRNGRRRNEGENDGDQIEDPERQHLTAFKIILDDSQVTAVRIELLIVHMITPFQ